MTLIDTNRRGPRITRIDAKYKGASRASALQAQSLNKVRCEICASGENLGPLFPSATLPVVRALRRIQDAARHDRRLGEISLRKAWLERYRRIVLTEYIQAALRHAHYELMENGRYFGSVPECEGAWAEGPTLEACREELRGAVESWIVGGLRHGDPLPVLEGIDLNAREPAHA